jgi:hypothetical protein
MLCEDVMCEIYKAYFTHHVLNEIEFQRYKIWRDPSELLIQSCMEPGTIQMTHMTGSDHEKSIEDVMETILEIWPTECCLHCEDLYFPCSICEFYYGAVSTPNVRCIWELYHLKNKNFSL